MNMVIHGQNLQSGGFCVVRRERRHERAGCATQNFRQTAEQGRPGCVPGSPNLAISSAAPFPLLSSSNLLIPSRGRNFLFLFETVRQIRNSYKFRAPAWLQQQRKLRAGRGGALRWFNGGSRCAKVCEWARRCALKARRCAKAVRPDIGMFYAAGRSREPFLVPCDMEFTAGSRIAIATTSYTIDYRRTQLQPRFFGWGWYIQSPSMRDESA